MAKKRTIADLADRNAELLDELNEIDAEIATRAGETDETETEPEAPQP